MRVTKKEIIIDLRYCKESLDRIIKHADKNFSHHTVIQKDIIKLRRELNEIRQKLQWDYEE